MRAKKDGLLTASQVPIVFSDLSVREITARLRPPLDDDQVRRFAASLRKAARVYIRDKQTPNDDDVGREIKALYWAADLHRYETAAKLVQDLSKQTRGFLKKRGARIGLKLPRPSFFLDLARRQAACEAVRRLCSQGGHMENGKWVPHLYLPKRQFGLEERVQERIRPAVKAANKRGVKVNMGKLRRKAVRYVTDEMVKSTEKRGVELKLRSPKRQTERDFIMFLQVAYFKATGLCPPVTARKYEQPEPDRTLKPSPFVQLVQKCLVLLGAYKIDVVEQINKLHSLRKRHPSHGKRQKRCK
jgi:hypothetical protein